MTENRQITLAERPRYTMPTSRCFKLRRVPLADPGEDEFLVRTLWLSLDPYLHARMKRVSPHAEPVPLGEVMVGATVGRVERSNHPGFDQGDLVVGFWGWQDFHVSNGSGVQKLGTEVEREHPSYALGPFNRIAGLGAWAAVTEVARPGTGETVVVGTATGGLGHLAGQIARLRGARVVGIAGSPAKCDFAVRELGYDACVCHKEKDFADRLDAACPEGIDVYLETVGGRVSAAVMPLMNRFARMPLLGFMSAWAGDGGGKQHESAASFLAQAMAKRLRVEGVVCVDYLQSHYSQFQRDMSNWIREGDIKVVEHVVPGLELAPAALQDMFQKSEHLGKLVVHVGN